MLDSDAPTSNEATTEAGDTTPPAAPPRRRRAASRPAGPPAAVVALEPAPEAEQQPELDVEPTEQPEQGTDETGQGELAEEAEEIEETEQGAGPVDETEKAEQEQAEQEQADPDQADPEQAAVVAEPPARQARRRRAASRPAGAPEPVSSEDVTASLSELAERSRGRRRPVVADVFAALDDLAAAIGGAPTASDTPDEQDEDSDVIVDETVPVADEESTDSGENDDPADSEDSDDSTDSDDSGSDADDSDQSPRRRRRRRGGRRRSRGADRNDSDSDSDSDSEDDPDNGESSSEESSDDSDAGADDSSDSDDNGDSGDNADNGESSESSSSGRRRRRRRRRGEDAGSTDDDGVDVVVKVREPRRASTASDQVTGIEGSTRMEAKRQRRREGRMAGRRRAPILSEAEFLARRESVERQMVIRQKEDYTQIAVLEDGVLVEHYVDRDSSASLIGNIYLGRVQNILPSMEAAFVDIGCGRNAVIYAGEVDWDSYGVSGDDRRVEKVFKSGQSILVQVTKDPVGAKGARLTNHISIPGRYVVYSPGGQLSGISRKLPEEERNRLKGVLDGVVGSDASVIVRTAAEGASEEELVRDVNRLKAQWDVIDTKRSGSAPQQLYAEPDLTVRIVRDLFTEDFGKLIVQGNGRGEDAYDTVQGYVTHVAPHLQERLRKWEDSEGDPFAVFRIDEQLSKALERKVHLPSGGSLVIDRTEAMTVVDVNTGRFTGTQGNLEATVTSNNLEAAEEIVRQLRLRDIGGIIVIDFIDMVLPANRELLLRRLVECLGRDRTRHQVAEVTSLGLVQMTRKKIGTGLMEAFTVPCENCSGRGYHIHESPVASQTPADGGDRDNGGRRGSSNGGGRRPRTRKDAGASESSGE